MKLETLPIIKQEPFFTDEERSFSKHNIQHIAIIPDGNRRWAKERSLPIVEGYLAGAQSLIKTSLAALELGIPVLTIYAFSTENWKRPKNECDLIFELVDEHLQYYCSSLIESNIRLHVIGDLNPLPQQLKQTIQEVTVKTATATGLDLILPINYGGRDEIVRAFKRLYQTGLFDNLKEEDIQQALDTHAWPDPDLIIRTSGEQRLSNFLIWQSSYAENYTDSVLWPDFSPHHLLAAIETYNQRIRRRGGS